MPAKPPTDAPKETYNPIEDDKMKKPTRFIPLLAFAVLCETAIADNHNHAQPQQSGNAYTQKVTREVMSMGQPKEAPGYSLELIRYTIPPRTKLPVHIHPGMQTERVEAGTLTFSVVQGTAYVTRRDGAKESVEAGQTVRINVGDQLTEPSGMVHYGENETDNPIVLITAALMEEGKPKAILIKP